MTPRIVGANIDTLILNIKGALRSELDYELDRWKQSSQEADEDLATPWTFVGQPLYIRAHGSGRQWRWILHCPSLHLDIGRGRLNGIIGKARLASVFLWEQGPEAALALLYAFLAGFYGEGFTLQVGEVHPCVDVVGWELALQEAGAFLTRGHHRTPHLLAEETGEAEEDPVSWLAPALDIQLSGRRCKGFDFSRGAAHACCIYDKTLELTVSHKAWMEAVWQANGWDGESRVTRVEFRYRRECLREMGVEEAYAFFDQLPSLWAYSTRRWLRHTVPTRDTNRGRWPLSPIWQAVQQAVFFGDGTPAVRERKVAGDLTLICQMLAGCSTTAAAFLAGQLPDTDDGSTFLRWFYDWMIGYLEKKGLSFEEVREDKRLRLGVVNAAGGSAA